MDTFNALPPIYTAYRLRHAAAICRKLSKGRLIEEERSPKRCDLLFRWLITLHQASGFHNRIAKQTSQLFLLGDTASFINGQAL